MSSTTPKAVFSTQRCWEWSVFNLPSGKLQQQLRMGEFPLFRDIPIFESDFILISKKGQIIDIHNSVQMVTVGIAATSPNLTIPDVMLLAQPASSYAASNKHDEDTHWKDDKSMRSLELTRLLPLKFVKLSIHDHEKNQLHLKLINDRSFFLQLFSPSDVEDLFAYWEDLVHLLRPPVEAYSGTQAEPASDTENLSPELEEEDKDLPAMELHGKGDQDQVSIRSLPTFPEVSGDNSPTYPSEEGIKQHFSNTYYMKRDAHSSTESDQEATPVTAKSSISLPGGSETVSFLDSEIIEKPKPKQLISVWLDKCNTGEQDGVQTIPQTETLKKKSNQERILNKRSAHPGRRGGDKATRGVHRSTRRSRKETQNVPGGHSAKVHSTQERRRLLKKSHRTPSKTKARAAP